MIPLRHTMAIISDQAGVRSAALDSSCEMEFYVLTINGNNTGNLVNGLALGIKTK